MFPYPNLFIHPVLCYNGILFLSLFLTCYQTKWTSPLQLPESLTHEGLVHFVRQCAAAKQLSLAHCVHPARRAFYYIGKFEELSCVIKKGTSLFVKSSVSFSSFYHSFFPAVIFSPRRFFGPLLLLPLLPPAPLCCQMPPAEHTRVLIRPVIQDLQVLLLPRSSSHH